MNIQILEEVKKLIREEPKRIFMGEWIVRMPDISCGTAACIAGWALLIDRRNAMNLKDDATWISKARHDVYDETYGREIRASVILGLSYTQAQALFFVWNWPEKFKDEYADACGNPEMKAEVVCQRIDHFIATNK